jgi:hypothetical protein
MTEYRLQGASGTACARCRDDVLVAGDHEYCWVWWWDTMTLGAGDAHSRPFHVAFCSSWARIKILCYMFGCEVGTPFEVPATYGF